MNICLSLHGSGTIGNNLDSWKGKDTIAPETYQHKYGHMQKDILTARASLFFFKTCSFLLEKQIYREEERQRGRFSHPMFHSPSDFKILEMSLPEASSQELFWVSHAIAGTKGFGHPHLLSQKTSRDWMRSRATVARTGAHIGSWPVQGEGLNHYIFTLGPARASL